MWDLVIRGYLSLADIHKVTLLELDMLAEASECYDIASEPDKLRE